MASVWKALSKQSIATTNILKSTLKCKRLIHSKTYSNHGFMNVRHYTFCSNASLSNRERFEAKILDLLEEEYEEKAFTELELPEIIINELTADFAKPKLVRISKTELYGLLQSNATSLMPLANILNHWTEEDDALQDELSEINKAKDVNYVEMDTQQEKAIITRKISDEELMQLMDNEYLNEYKGNTLYETAMHYYDISSASDAKSVDINNRISSVLLTLAAYLGHTEAQLQLGKQYLLGYGVETDYKSAIYHFVRSGASGSVEARTYLGIMYMKGYGVKQNMERAETLLNESSRFMNPIAQRYLAEIYEKKTDYYIALRLAEKACGSGQIKLNRESNKKVYDDKFIMEAATICGRMYCVHLNDFLNGVKYFEIAADMNDMDAQCNLGHIYWIGIPNTIEANIYKAVSYLLNAANKGHKRAHRELGMIYSYTQNNKDIENLNEGVSWLDLAGKEGYIDCYLRLGEIYASGNNKYNGIKQEFKIAKKYIEMARDESSLSKNHRDKLPENIWNLMLKNPLQAVNLIENYEKAIQGKWRGQYLSDLDPVNYQKIMT